MITIAKEFKNEEVLVVGDMECGDSFAILNSDWNDVYLLCNNDTFVEISTGETFDTFEWRNLPVRKCDFVLVEK